MQAEVEDSFCHHRAGGLFPHPTDCSKFVICTYGRAITQSCAASMLFDAQVKSCNYEHSTSCVGNLQVDYPGQAYPEHTPGYYGDRHVLRETPADNPIHYYANNKDIRQRHKYKAPYYRARNTYHGFDADRHALPGRHHDIHYSEPHGVRETELSYSDNRRDFVYTPTEPHYNRLDRENYHDTHRAPDVQNRHRVRFPHDFREVNANNVHNDRHNKHAGPNRDYYGNVYGTQTRQSYPEYETNHQTKQTKPRFQIDIKDDKEDYIPRRSFINPDIKSEKITPTRELVKERRKPIDDTLEIIKPVIVDQIEETKDKHDKEPSMFHFVHVDIPDPDIFKRVRRPGESFIDFTAETQKEGKSSCHYL